MEARYVGETENNKANGKGILYYDDGSRYEGEFKDGNFHGKGIFYFEDGERYECEFKDGKKNGKGIYYCEDGTTRYEGECKKFPTTNAAKIYLRLPKQRYKNNVKEIGWMGNRD
ncbi:MAG: hypothetical protein HQ522_22255 [Bacteroidetes bacterium]|nr:hypothetical protein [Bacteroidota bacterium]